MIYCTSDLHGYPLNGFLKLLTKAGFTDSDSLYVLGDVIDRNGDGGISLLRWMISQPNVHLIMGNHESMLLECDFLFDEVTDRSIDRLCNEDYAKLIRWTANGGDCTITALSALNRTDPEEFRRVLDHLESAAQYEEIDLYTGRFILTHSGLGNFSPDRPIEEYTGHDLMWHRPNTADRYYPDRFTVFGHTPTEFFGTPGRAFRTDTWIDIDTGAAGGDPPMLLRLDDMREFYMDTDA